MNRRNKKNYHIPPMEISFTVLIIGIILVVYITGCISNNFTSDTKTIRENHTPITYQEDIDNDGISDYDEINIYHTDPKRPNPVLSYAIKNGINQTLYDCIKILDEDGKMDKNEKELIDALVFIQKDLIPDNIKVYYPEKKETKLMSDSIKSLYPKDYLSRNDILFWQKELISSVLADRKISDREIFSIKKLENEKRWWIVRDIIDSGMINDHYLDDDWDDDGISNIEEIYQGTNPLNDLETNPDNLSERYAIIVNGISGLSYEVGELYHLLKRNGYDDNHIIFFHYNTNPEPKVNGIRVVAPSFFSWLNSTIPKNNWFIWYIVNYPNTEIDFNTSQVTPENFLDAIRNLPSDNNDYVFIYYTGHGRGPLGSLGIIPPEDFNKALNSIKYGRLVYIQESCDAGEYLSELNAPIKLHQALMIGSTVRGPSTNLSDYLFSPLDQGYSLKEAFESAKEDIKQRFMNDERGKRLWENGVHPIVYWYDTSKKECDWWSYFSPVKYLPKS